MRKPIRIGITLTLLWRCFIVLANPTSDTTTDFETQWNKIRTANGFLAALDQSGGSTPKVLKLYGLPGLPEDACVEGEASMFEQVHAMRTRIMTAKAFRGDRILGAILFEDTMDRTVQGMPTAQYLWQVKQIVPFLKCDKGLADVENGVQIMKPMPDLDALLKKAKEKGIFGTKMRSVIQTNNVEGIRNVVNQQFEIGKQIIRAGLVPIIEPEVDIHSPEKAECEIILKTFLLEKLNSLADDEKVILKLSLPSVENYYQECIEHPNCLRVVALSGGYSRVQANELLSKQNGMIGSFSRALAQDLRHSMSEEEYEKELDTAIQSIFEASKT